MREQRDTTDPLALDPDLERRSPPTSYEASDLRVCEAIARALSTEHVTTCVATQVRHAHRSAEILLEDANGLHQAVHVVEPEPSEIRVLYTGGRFDKVSTIVHIERLVTQALERRGHDAHANERSSLFLAISVALPVGAVFINLLRRAVSASAAGAYREVWLVAADRAVRLTSPTQEP
ncbi:MAG: hypothetical protein H0T89_23650 [Deltaproteobacteria bacterium]|nr:hypothetical protein [Deltaproteobacteria bacterium]MDQ3296916.1 hypothetical protein [Myxococcota bacterium]